MKTVMVAGPRELGADVFRVALSIDAYFAEAPEKMRVIHGAAPGVDSIAAGAAERHGHEVVAYPVNQADRREASRGGSPRKAPLYRTLRMLNDDPPDMLMTWWDGKSRGTGFTIAQAKKRGIPHFNLPVKT